MSPSFWLLLRSELWALDELKGDAPAMRILFTCTLSCVILRIFATSGADWDTGGNEALVNVNVVDTNFFKALVAARGGAVSKALGWTSPEARRAWKIAWPAEQSKGFMIMLSTKVTHYLTNYRTKQTGSWTSYSAQTIMGIDPKNNPAIETSVWTVGHPMSTIGACSFLFEQMEAHVGLASTSWDKCITYTRGSGFYGVVSQLYKVGTDITQRMSQLPAGCRYVANIVAVARRIRDSSYAVFITQEIVDHVRECFQVFTHALKIPILYHVGASYFWAGIMPNATSEDHPKEIPQASDIAGRFAAYLSICMGKSDMAKMKCLGAAALDSELAKKVSAARAAVRVSGGAKEMMKAVTGDGGTAATALSFCGKLGGGNYDANADPRTLEIVASGKPLDEAKKKRRPEITDEGAAAASAAVEEPDDE